MMGKRRGSPPPFADDASDNPGIETSPVPPVIVADDDDFVHQPHDSFFKSLFGDVRNAAEVMRTALPPRVAAHIDWDSLQVVSASFVDDALKQRHGDMMYRARLTQGGETFLWVLFEHQSTVEERMAWRMLRMMFRTLDTWWTQHPEATRLPPVLPVVLYQGTAPWTAPLSVAELFELSEEARRDFGEHLPSFRYVLEDLQAMSDEELLARDLSPVTRVSLMIMKHGRSEHLMERLVLLGERGDLLVLVSTEYGLAAWWRGLRYATAINERINLETLTRLLVPITGPKMEEAMLTYGQKLELEITERVTAKVAAQTQRDLLLQQLEWRFGALPEAVTDRISQAGKPELERWARRILDAASLDDVLSA
jgi:Putative transposase, YhgA-like